MCNNYQLTGTSYWGSGSAITDAIIDQNGGAASAAQECRSYEGCGETDWFLPSKDELNAIWVNLVVDGAGANSGVGRFAAVHYWSSSEANGYIAWDLDFILEGGQFQTGKGEPYYVRAIRAF